MLSKRVQVLVEASEYEKIKKISRESRKSVGEIFREAVKLYGERLVSRTERLEIVEKMSKLKLPVSDWLIMEKRISRAHSA